MDDSNVRPTDEPAVQGIDNLLVEAERASNALCAEFSNEFITSQTLNHAYRIHAQGRLLLRGIDRDIYRAYCALFSASPSEQYEWDKWNAYVLDQFHRCVGILRMVKMVGWRLAKDTTASKVFISHGKFNPAFTRLESFIRAIGCLPVYDVEEPTAGKTINQHVQRLFDQSDFYVILATSETQNVDGTKLPNHNVTVEMDRLQRQNVDRLLLLVEEGCRMPSMLQDVIWQPFTQQCMDQAFTRLAGELNRLALL